MESNQHQKCKKICVQERTGREQKAVSHQIGQMYVIHLLPAILSWKVKIVREDAYYMNIIAAYPETISKETMCKICHLSKRKALTLLEKRVIPCEDTGKATHRFKIATVDVVEYLRFRDTHPEVRDQKVQNPLSHTAMCVSEKELRPLYTSILAAYPDLLSVQDVHAITGYSTKTVNKWCTEKLLFHFLIGRKNLIPKESLLTFMAGKRFGTICPKSTKHMEMLERLRE